MQLQLWIQVHFYNFLLLLMIITINKTTPFSILLWIISLLKHGIETAQHYLPKHKLYCWEEFLVNIKPAGIFLYEDLCETSSFCVAFKWVFISANICRVSHWFSYVGTWLKCNVVVSWLNLFFQWSSPGCCWCLQFFMKT